MRRLKAIFELAAEIGNVAKARARQVDAMRATRAQTLRAQATTESRAYEASARHYMQQAHHAVCAASRVTEIMEREN